MSASAAHDIFAADKGFGLKYVMAENDKVALAYGYINSETYYLDPFTGQQLGYDGNAYKKQTERSYSDISGKWYETIVTKLLNNGYFIDSDTFSGNSQITQEGFLRYLYAPEQSWYDGSDAFYEMLEAYDIVTKSERAPTQLLTRQDAAKFAIRYAGQGLSAKHYEIYKNQFTDSIQEEYMGYAALAKAFGIMSGDAKGRFNGTNILTNAEAAVIIYNTLELE